jgi:FlaA1/EpsC-like NDP-sugar epimerase
MEQLISSYNHVVERVRNKDVAFLGGAVAIAIFAVVALKKKKKSLKGKTIVLTGAANGLGRALAEKLAKQECKLIIWDIDEVGLNKTVEIVKQTYPSA